MFKPETDENVALQMIQIIKNKLIEQLQDYGAIEKMEPRSQTALIKRLGNLISERAASQVKYDYFPTKKPQEIVSEPVEQPRVVEEKPDYSQPTAPIQTSTPVSQAQGTGQVEDLLEYIGHKTEPLSQGVSDDKKVELAQELLEQAKRDSIVKVISSIVKGLSTKTGVCFVFTGDKGALETITYGMSEKHAEFVLGILSKYPEVVKQTIESQGEEKTLDAGDGVVILEETESGMLVSITKNREEISVISKRMKLVTTLISEFLKPSF
jgi:hypothetical protein